MKLKIKMFEHIKNYKLKSTYLKTLFFLLILILVPLVCFILVINYAYGEITKAEVKFSSESILLNISNYNDNILKSILDQINWHSYDLNTVAFLNKQESESSQAFDSKKLILEMQTMKSNNPCIESIYLYSRDSDRIITSLGDNAIFSEFRDNAWLSENYDNILRNQRYIDNRVIHYEDIYSPVISIYQNIIINYENAGIFVVNISSHNLKNMLIAKNNKNLDLLIYDSDNKLIFATDKNLTPPLLTDNTDSSSSVITNHDNDRMAVSHLKSAKTRWSYIVFLNNPLSSPEAQSLRMTLQIAITTIVLWIAIFVLYISYKLIQPINNIIEVLKEYMHTQGSSMQKSENEITLITNTISNIISNNKSNQEELILSLNVLKKAQISALQYQINPHFLYNTLATIRYMAIEFTGDENRVSTALSYLGSNLRAALNPNNLTTVKREVEYANKYIELQKLRYKDRFEIFIDIDPEVQNLLTVKLILQPIIENSISHGISSSDKKGAIHISCKKTGDLLEFTIKDNGVGMSDKVIEALNLNSEVISETNAHFGIKNVNQRLKILFGNEYGVKIFSKQNVGTIVMLNMPIIKM